MRLVLKQCASLPVLLLQISLAHHFLGSGSSLESLFSLDPSFRNSLLFLVPFLRLPLPAPFIPLGRTPIAYIKTEPMSLIKEEIFLFLLGQPFYDRKGKKRTKYLNICVYSQKFYSVIFCSSLRSFLLCHVFSLPLEEEGSGRYSCRSRLNLRQNQ